MSNEELEEAIDLILDFISRSKMNNYAKIELFMNLKTFFQNYEENISVLRKHNQEKGRKK